MLHLLRRFDKRRPLADAEPVVHPHQRLGRPPVPAAHHMHERRHQDHPHQGGIHKHGERQAEAEHPHERHMGGDQRGERHRHHQSRGGDDPAGAGHAERHTFVVGGVRLWARFAGRAAPEASQYSRILEIRNTS